MAREKAEPGAHRLADTAQGRAEGIVQFGIVGGTAQSTGCLGHDLLELAGRQQGPHEIAAHAGIERVRLNRLSQQVYGLVQVAVAQGDQPAPVVRPVAVSQERLGETAVCGRVHAAILTPNG
jgi:hypothetical protein